MSALVSSCIYSAICNSIHVVVIVEIANASYSSSRFTLISRIFDTVHRRTRRENRTPLSGGRKKRTEDTDLVLLRSPRRLSSSGTRCSDDAALTSTRRIVFQVIQIPGTTPLSPSTESHWRSSSIVCHCTLKLGARRVFPPKDSLSRVHRDRGKFERRDISSINQPQRRHSKLREITRAIRDTSGRQQLGALPPRGSERPMSTHVRHVRAAKWNWRATAPSRPPRESRPPTPAPPLRRSSPQSVTFRAPFPTCRPPDALFHRRRSLLSSISYTGSTQATPIPFPTLDRRERVAACMPHFMVLRHRSPFPRFPLPVGASHPRVMDRCARCTQVRISRASSLVFFFDRHDVTIDADPQSKIRHSRPEASGKKW